MIKKNDAMTNISDVIALDEAVDVAIEFANKHPEETLILVTGDHETGGMSIGQATTGYDTSFDILSNQKISYVAFDKLINKYKESTKAENEILYGSYEPLSVTLTHIINNKAGIGWISYSHTGVPVPVYAMGASAEKFVGSYDNTDIFNKLVDVCGLK